MVEPVGICGDHGSGGEEEFLLMEINNNGEHSWWLNFEEFQLSTEHKEKPPRGLQDCLGVLDSWLQAGFVLTTDVNCAYVLGYSAAVMVPLGWIGGVVGLIAATIITLYANALIAKLHEHGGKRHIRYRDLAGFIYGTK